LFVGKLDAHELIVGAGASLIGAIAADVVFATHLVSLWPNLGALAQVWRLPKEAVTGTWSIFAVLARQLVGRGAAPSRLLTVRFEVGGDDGASAMRRALAIAYTTMTPTSVVLGIDRRRGLLVYHQLDDSPVAELTRQ